MYLVKRFLSNLSTETFDKVRRKPARPAADAFVARVPSPPPLPTQPFIHAPDITAPPAKRMKPSFALTAIEEVPPEFSLVAQFPHLATRASSPKTTNSSAAVEPTEMVDLVTASDAAEGTAIPGPAGALPPLSRFAVEDLDRTVDSFLKGQLGNDDAEGAAGGFRTDAQMQVENKHDFGRGAWLEMLHQEKFHPFSVEKPPKRMEQSVCWVLEEGYKSKVKNLCVLVKLLQIVDDDAYVVLRDPTGEISATVHSRVIELYHELTAGAVLWLEDVSVLSESPKSHHLIITHRNIRFLWPAFTTTTAALPTKFSHVQVRFLCWCGICNSLTGLRRTRRTPDPRAKGRLPFFLVLLVEMVVRSTQRCRLQKT